MSKFGSWQRLRGVASSKSIEPASFVYKGKAPTCIPKKRMYVDGGSSLFNQVMRSVPLLAPDKQAFVDRDVRAASLLSMVGAPHDEDQSEQQKLKLLPAEDDDGTGLHQQDKADVEDISRAATKIKKRRLYKQLSGTDVRLFPHDNSIDLLKELCWEAGRPRWIFHGTPAGGAGVHGCLEAGSSVVALCYDEHHRIQLKRFLSERAVEAMVTGTTQVFKDDALLARSVERNLTMPMPPMAASANKKQTPEEKHSSDEQETEAKPKAKNERKQRKPKATSTRKKRARSRSVASRPTPTTTAS